MKFRTLLMFLLAAIATGCMADKRTYQITVKNQTSTPLTIGQVKEGYPYEELWASPEDLALDSPRGGDQIWGVIVAPGKARTTEPFEGRFDARASAWLRVYLGRLTFSELLAISSRSPNRVDVRLHPGRNTVVITQSNGALGFTIEPSTQPVSKE
jgi:hypothetical protein